MQGKVLEQNGLFFSPMTQLIAHRGLADGVAENTLEAYDAAIEAGADCIELDVRRTRDDVLIISHDAHLPDGRTIIQLTADELPPEVPSLVDVFEHCPGVSLNVEIKNEISEPDYDETNIIAIATAGLVAAYRDPTNVLVTSFNTRTIDMIQQTDPTIPAGVVAFDAPDPMLLIERAIARGHSAINPWEMLASSRLIDRAHAEGIAVNVWTVNERDAMERLLDLGVDGIITDNVRLGRQVIDEHRGR